MSETRYIYEATWGCNGKLDYAPREIVKETEKIIRYTGIGWTRPSQIHKSRLNMVVWSTVYSLSPEAARKAWLDYAKKQIDFHNRQLEKWYKRIDTLKEANDG